MNEQIVKLFMQSVDSNYIPLPIEDHIPSWTEKFAELIIKETLQVARAGIEYGDGMEDAVCKYFGVE
jgi:hypothetical protein